MGTLHERLKSAPSNSHDAGQRGVCLRRGCVRNALQPLVAGTRIKRGSPAITSASCFCEQRSDGSDRLAYRVRNVGGSKGSSCEELR